MIFGKYLQNLACFVNEWMLIMITYIPPAGDRNKRTIKTQELNSWQPSFYYDPNKQLSSRN